MKPPKTPEELNEQHLPKEPGRRNKAQDLEPDTSDGRGEALTTDQGARITDNQNSLKAGVRGPGLLEDFVLREKIMHFDHERIPERVVHARGAGAHGHFQLYKPLPQWTRAHFLNDVRHPTPVFVRFSTVAGSKGSTDLARDVRGFAVKFYTQEGIHDLVGNNIPVFFIQDAMKFPDLVHAVKPEPHHEMPQAASAHDTFWDFIGLMPESMHMIMWAMSDRAIPRSYRMMEGFGVHTFRFVNGSGVSHFVKFHWKPLLGLRAVAWDEAQKISGKDPDFHRRDLWEAIEKGDHPQWELGVQVFSEEEADAFPFDVLDATKLIPEEMVPVQPVGLMTLDRNPHNFFSETEQVAFHPGHIVPGIDFSNDPLLQGRLFSYSDTQLSRLGSANFHELPINRSIAPVHNNQRDGHMRHTINKGQVAYEPNSLGGGCPFQALWDNGGFRSVPEPAQGTKVRERAPKFHDHFSQATLFYRSQSPVEQTHIRNALRFELGKLEVPHVRDRVIALLGLVDRDLAQGVAEAFGGEVPVLKGWVNGSIPAGTDPAEVQPTGTGKTKILSPALSMEFRPGRDASTLRMAVLSTDQASPLLAALKDDLERAGLGVKIISPRQEVVRSGDRSIAVDHALFTTSSVLFDGIALFGDPAVLQALPDARDFVVDAFRHCKTIAFDDGMEPLLEAFGTGPEAPGMVRIGKEDSFDSVRQAMTIGKHWARERDPLTGERNGTAHHGNGR